MRRDITLDELRNIQLDILDKIDEYCRKNNLRYSLGGGTLLGAVRHKGYIPWDDDIDVMLPRPDYEKFISGFDGLYENYKLEGYKNRDNYFLLFSKVYDNRTTLIDSTHKGGIYVDVFPIDGLPVFSQVPGYIDEMHAIQKQLRRTSKFYEWSGNKAWEFVKYLIKRMITPSRKVIIKQLDDFFNRYDFESSDYAGSIVGVYAEKEAMKADVFRHYIELTFEGRTYSGIADYDAYLTKHYGDYMKLPPKDQQVSNHNFIAYWN